MTAATKLTPAEMLELLQKLEIAADKHEVIENRIEGLFLEIREHEDDLVGGLRAYEPAVWAQIMAATRPLDEDDRDAAAIRDEIVEAIDVLRFAMERGAMSA